jgi:HlyD family type I secretion membrane fusion protein
MEQSLTLIRRGRTDLLQAPISAFESETQAVIQTTSPFSERAILYVLAGMLVLAVILMSVVKLDRVVSGSGRILPTQGSLFVQPLDRSIVTRIAVRSGDVVRKGQLLATLDPTFALADLRDLQQKKAAAESLVARLLAEKDGQPYLGNPSSPESMLQAAIFTQRHAEYQQTLADLEARVRSGMSSVQRASEDQRNYQERLAIARQSEQAQQTLQERGFGRRLSLLDAQDARVEMQRMVTESRQTAAQGQHDVVALSATRAAFISKWQGDIAGQLVTAQNSLSAINQSLAKASKISDLSRLVAPANSVVLKIGKANIGSVIDPSTNNTEPLFTLTPLDGPLHADLNIDAKDIAYIRTGDQVRLKLDAYQFTSHGTATGVIKTISDGSFTTTDDGQVVRPYYKATVAITDLRLRNVPSNFRLTPGLTVSGEIRIGRRTIMQYLFGGALKTGSEAMREPS